MTDEVIDALRLPKQVNYLHLPVQSGNNEVLKRMNRKYTREQYLDVIRRIRAKVPTLLWNGG
jgi:tRNA-2-methylthio-N6-dimethylallyladenosine synthase